MSDVVYIDTSALAKWYLNEDRSDDVEAFLTKTGPAAVSTLTLVEMRSLLARRRRDREITARHEARVFATVQEDVRHGFLVCHPVGDETFTAALAVLTLAADHPLRTLDALHLAIARELGAAVLATADRVQAAAARKLGLKVVSFG